MAINFPSPANPGDVYSYNGYIWQYTSGGYWRSVAESDYIYSATTVGVGTSVISGITGGNLYLKSFSGNNITISESNGTLTFSASSTTTSNGNFLPLSGGTVTGATNYTAGLSANTISATTYQNLPVSGVTNGTGISASTTNGVVTISNTQVQGITGRTDGLGISSSISNNVITITNTDLGSSQNIFKNIQINGNPQFSAGSNNDNLNFSGINVTIISAATNTLVFSAGTGGPSTPFDGGTVSGPTIFTGGVTANTLNVTGVTTSLTFLSSQSVGDEGGQIDLAKAQTNTTLSGSTISIDIYQNRLRFFESASPNRGAYIDLSKASNGVSSDLLVNSNYGKIYTTGNNLNFI